MKKGMVLLLLIGIGSISVGCKGNRVDEDIYQKTRDVFLEELYSDKEGFYWYYEESNDEERMVISPYEMENK